MDKDSKCCKECYERKQSDKFKKELKQKISKETLMQLVREKSFVEIGKLYNVSDNSVKKWCKRYLIPFRKEDINNISLEDWNKECNLTKEEYKNKYLNNKKEKNNG